MKENRLKSVVSTVDLVIGYVSKKEIIEVASNINIDLCQGELIGLIGANGIGKSTLLRTLTNVQPKLNGDIYLNKKPLNSFNSQELARTLSLVLTEAVASKNLTVFELVALGRYPYTNWLGKLSHDDNQVVNHAIEQTAIGEFIHKKCFELSDGQLQKVMIARALAQDTNLIILDEPTTHLDMYHKAYVLNLLKKLTRETNKTILFSSHEIDLATQLCDKLIVMTDESCIIDTPENHISHHNFDKLFPKDLITFDANTKSFKVNK